MYLCLRDTRYEIRPLVQGDLDAVLEVYRQCEDFLALGPVPTASMEMVLADIGLSRTEGGIFCGIYTAEGKMIGVIDYVRSHYRGDPGSAYLELLMIAAPYRNQGIGRAVVEVVEADICEGGCVKVIYSGVQVNNPQAIRFWQGNGYRIVSEPTLQPDQTTAMDLRKDVGLGE